MQRIEVLSASDARACAAWDDYVQTCPAATFFHRSRWQRVLRDAFGHDTFFLYAQTAGRIVGVLPLAHVRSWLFGHSLVSLPFAVYGGVAADTPLAADALEREAQRLAQSLGVMHLELRNVTHRHQDWPQQDLYVTFRKAISADDEQNLLAVPRKQRAMVRKGIKNGLRSTVDDGPERFFALYSDNVHRHGTPALPRTYFQKLVDEFGPQCEILTVEDATGRPVSSVMSFYFRDEVLPYYAGDHVAARDLAGNDFKYWELMRRAAARGVKVFDYGRSKKGSGSYAFKTHWGFEPSPLHYEYRLYRRATVPQNNPSNAKYRLLIEAWRRMPLRLANWLGPYLVRGLG